MKESHNSWAVWQVGFFKYYYNARRYFSWKGMQTNIQQYVAECNKFQRKKRENVLTPWLLHPLHIPNQKWEEISMEFINGLPLSEGKDKIFVVVYRLTKFAHFMAIKNIDTNKLQIYSTKISTNYMYSQKSLSMIEMWNLKRNFGGKFSNKWVPHSIWAQLIIPKHMVILES